MIPQRYNPVPIQLKQFTVGVGQTPKDPDFDEPNQGQEKTYDTLLDTEAQISYGKKDRREAAMTGDPGNSEGHLTFRRSDLVKAGIVLSKGDLVVSVAGFPVNFKVIEVRPTGHLRKKANLIMAFFAQNDETNPSLRR